MDNSIIHLSTNGWEMLKLERRRQMGKVPRCLDMGVFCKLGVKVKPDVENYS